MIARRELSRSKAADEVNNKCLKEIFMPDMPLKDVLLSTLFRLISVELFLWHHVYSFYDEKNYNGQNTSGIGEFIFAKKRKNGHDQQGEAGNERAH